MSICVLCLCGSLTAPDIDVTVSVGVDDNYPGVVLLLFLLLELRVICTLALRIIIVVALYSGQR